MYMLCGNESAVKPGMPLTSVGKSKAQGEGAKKLGKKRKNEWVGLRV